MSAESHSDAIEVHASTSRQYWTFQVVGWSTMALLSFLSLTIWYNPGQVAPALHTLLQSLLGIIVSHPLRYVARATWREPILRRAMINGVSVIIASLIWTALRVQTFTLLTGEVIPPTDWGGWIFASIIVFGAWAFCYHAFKYYRQSVTEHRLTTEAQNAALRARARAQEESFKRLEAEKLFRDSQMRMLKYQLNPHFFLNALNSVSAMVRKGERDAAMDMLARIGQFMRLSLSDPEDVQHTLDEELDALDVYLSIERIRFGDRLLTEFEVDEAARSAMVPSLLLQPLFENAIKFAVGRRIEPTTISFTAASTEAGLLLELTDNGPGLERRDLQTVDGGIGLANVRLRLESTYDTAFSFDLEEVEPHGVRVSILISGPATGKLGT